MYTRCPDCKTTFKLGVNDLRRAQGKVRCGDCENVFNALEYLTDDLDEDEGLPTLQAGGRGNFIRQQSAAR